MKYNGLYTSFFLVLLLTFVGCDRIDNHNYCTAESDNISLTILDQELNFNVWRAKNEADFYRPPIKTNEDIFLSMTDEFKLPSGVSFPNNIINIVFITQQAFHNEEIIDLNKVLSILLYFYDVNGEVIARVYEVDNLATIPIAELDGATSSISSNDYFTVKDLVSPKANSLIEFFNASETIPQPQNKTNIFKSLLEKYKEKVIL